MTHNFSPQTIETKKCLVVVSAKEHGNIYVTVDGNLKHLEHVSKHPPSYSDNEGFFTRSSHGRDWGSGAPREVDKEHNIEVYIKAISEELSAVVAAEKPEVIFVFEPEHMKNFIAENLVNPNHIPVQTLDYGNFLHESTAELQARLVACLTAEVIDPALPSSVKDGEPHAEEVRKILEVGQSLEGK